MDRYWQSLMVIPSKNLLLSGVYGLRNCANSYAYPFINTVHVVQSISACLWKSGQYIKDRSTEYDEQLQTLHSPLNPNSEWSITKTSRPFSGTSILHQLCEKICVNYYDLGHFHTWLLSQTLHHLSLHCSFYSFWMSVADTMILLCVPMFTPDSDIWLQCSITWCSIVRPIHNEWTEYNGRLRSWNRIKVILWQFNYKIHFPWITFTIL